MRKLTLLVAGLFMLCASAVYGQSRTISGTVVTSSDNEPVIGASILVKGTTNGTISDVDGSFELQVSDGAILVVSYVGLKTAEVPAKNGVVVKLEADAIVLDEVISVAYGTSTKKAFAGSAAVVSSETMEKKNPTEISKALAGTVAGVQVVNTSGQPGSTASIRIRGIGSVNASAAPLYVVDGIPLTGGDLSSIDPSDIATTTILKDATATSLYGSRGANGVVLITTKKGTSGETGKIDVDVKYGVNARFIPLYDVITSPERFVELGWEGLKNQQLLSGKTESAAATLASNNLFSTSGLPVAYNMWDTPGKLLIDPSTGKFYTDIQRKYTPEKWSDYLFGTGQKYEANVKIHGGSDKTTYYTSFGYLKDEGYYIGSDYSRFTARANVDHQAKKWLKGNLNMAYTYAETNQPGQSDNMNNGFQFVNFMPAIYPVFQRDAQGNIVQDPLLGGNKFDYGMYSGYGRTYAAGVNPAGALQLDKDRTTQHDFTGSAMLEIQFYKDLKLTTNVGLQYVGANNADLTNWFYGDAAGKGRITKTQTNYLALTANQILAYQKTIDKHNIDAFVAHESTLYSVSQMTGQKSNLADPYGLEWSNAVVYGYMESVSESYSLESYFGQARYNYDEKYFVHGTLRGDGSSRFEKGNRWGLFGSIGAAWLMSNEDFLQGSDIVKNLKLKASWGVLGNQELGSAYPTKSVYKISNVNDEIAYTWVSQGNPDLTWEHSSIFNTGVEFDITKYLAGEIEYYYKKTDQMLFTRAVAPSMGFASYDVNDAVMSNQGVEFTLTGHLVDTRSVKLDLSVNGGFYKNTLLEMPHDEAGQLKDFQSAGAYGWSKGHSIFDYCIREYAGVDPADGAAMWYKYSDADGNTVTNVVEYMAKNPNATLVKETTKDYADAGLNYVGKSAIPALQGGFNVDLEAYGFDFAASFAYGLGGYGYDAVYANLMHNETIGQYNWHKDIENRWTTPGQITDVPRLSNAQDQYVNSSSTRFLTSNSYLNLTNVRLGYSLPKKMVQKIKMNNINIWVSGDNLFLLSARDGYVPYGSLTGDSDRSQYVPLSTVMCGVKVQF